MKRCALIFEAPHRVGIHEEDLPAPVEGEVLCRTICSAISAGTERLVYRGEAPEDMALDDTIEALRGRFAFPLRYGYACVGEVVETGAGVERLSHGRRVFAFHPHASHFVCPEKHCLPLPDDVTAEDAALLPSCETALHFVMDGRPMIGEQIVVFGQGAVGLLLTSLLSQLKPSLLLTFEPCAARRKLSVAWGASASLEPGSEEDRRQATAWLESNPPSGADLAFEVSGNPAALDQAVSLTGRNGRVIVGSWYGTKPVTLDLGGSFHRSGIRLQSSQVSRLPPDLTGRWTTRRRLAEAMNQLGTLRPSRLISHRIPFDQPEEAYRLLEADPTSVLQIILTYD